MGDFLDLVRRSGVAHPPQRHFSRKKWDASFSKIHNPDDDDKKLYQAGLWIDDTLTDLRNLLNNTGVLNISGAARLLYTCALINNDTMIADQLSTKKPKGNTIFINSLPENRIKLPNGILVRPDDLIESSVDMSRFALRFAMSASHPSDTPPDTITENDLNSIIAGYRLANAYHIADQIWLECLWGNKEIEVNEDGTYIALKDINFAAKISVTKYRHDKLIVASVSQLLSAWEHKLTREAKEAMCQRRVPVRAHTKNGKLLYELGKHGHSSKTMPLRIMQRALALEDHISPYQDERLPNSPQISVRILLDAWEVLHALAQCLTDRCSTHPKDAKQLRELCLCVPRDGLLKLLNDSLGVNNDVAAKCLIFLTYTNSIEDEGWTKPLVPIGGNNFCLLVPCLLHGNLARAAERWLQSGGFDLSERGTPFERFVKDELKDALSNSRALRTARLIEESIRPGEIKEEIDLIIRVRNTIILGEIKCLIFPANDIEMHNHIERLKGGADQAKRKADALSHEIGKFSHELGFGATPPDNVSVVPVVITNSLICAGYPQNDVPVVDLSYIKGLFAHGRLSTLENGAGDVLSSTLLYDDINDFESKIDNLLRHPPVTKPWERLLRIVRRPMPIKSGAPPIIEIFLEVSMDSLSESGRLHDDYVPQ